MDAHFLFQVREDPTMQATLACVRLIEIVIDTRGVPSSVIGRKIELECLGIAGESFRQDAHVKPQANEAGCEHAGEEDCDFRRTSSIGGCCPISGGHVSHTETGGGLSLPSPDDDSGLAIVGHYRLLRSGDNHLIAGGDRPASRREYETKRIIRAVDAVGRWTSEP